MHDGGLSLSVIVVSWNSGTYLVPLLRQLGGLRDRVPGTEVVVIDNASTDGTPGIVAAQFPWIRLLRSTENSGFAAAANRGAAAATGRLMLLVNPDISLEDLDALAALLRRAEAATKFGVWGCKLVHGDGTLQSAGERFPSFASIAAEYLGFARMWRRSSRVAAGFRDVDWVSGAFMLVRRELYEQVGLFSERFFMYGEDVDFCVRVRRAGWRVGVFTDYTVIHYHSVGAQRRLAAMLVHSARGTLRVMTALNGGTLSPGRRLLLRLILSGGAILRGLIRLPLRPRTGIAFLQAGAQILRRLEVP